MCGIASGGGAGGAGGVLNERVREAEGSVNSFAFCATGALKSSNSPCSLQPAVLVPLLRAVVWPVENPTSACSNS
eukprot:1332950-Pleurochrysis_carterae.AAC.2